MSKKIYYSILCLFITLIMNAQVDYPGYFEDYHEPEDPLKSTRSGTVYIPYGNVFTPKGDIRAMIVCAGFGEPYDSWECPNWPTGSNTLPTWANNPEYMYSNYSDFTAYASSNHNQNFSRFYYEMSGQQFRFVADVFPNRINIDPTSVTSWWAANNKVMDTMKSQYPNFDWSPYDNRENPPKYEFDNSQTNADSIVDFLIIAYRYNNDTSWTNNFPIAYGIGNGWAANDISSSFTYNNYKFNTDCGYTQKTGGSSFYGLFIHELAHNIFNSPHYAMANGIVGNYFYGQQGWGMMSLNHVFNSALGWERWLLNWIDIEANGEDAEINSASDLNSTGEYILRDHITTGDVIRIKLNNGNGTNQYLWLENHQGLSIFDNRTWTSNGCGGALPNEPRGLVAYIESIKNNKSSPIEFWTDVESRNGIKFINATGNYDYSNSAGSTTPCTLWGNEIYNLSEVALNPISGQSRAEMIRWDINSNGTIGFNNDANNTSNGNEHHWVAKRNGTETLDFLGVGLAFPTGQKLGMDTNPALSSRPLYNSSTSAMGYAYLNGISVKKIADLSGNQIKVKIEFNDVEVNNNVRWTGNIALNNITNNTNADLILKAGKQITYNRSGTANRTTKIDNKFINYTNFRCESGSYFKMESGSKVILDENSTFTLQSGSTLEIEDEANFIVMNSSKLVVESGASIIVKGRGGITFKCSGQLCANTEASIILQDALSSIHFVGTGGLSPGCLSSLSGVLSGNGSVRNYTSSLTVSNTTISSDTYYSGSTITSTNVTVQGTGTDLTYSITNGATINGPFEVPLGATFEVRLNSTSCSN